jgi:tetratricopeptide (TPR) repeat protein
VSQACERDLVEARRVAAEPYSADGVLRLRELAERVDKSAELWKLLGLALMKLERNEEALTALLRSTWSVARDVEVWVCMAICAHRIGKSNDAVAYWKSAVQAQPDLFQRRPALATLWRECRGSEARYDAVVGRLASRKDERAAIELLEAVLTEDDIPAALASINRAASFSPPLALAAFIFRQAAPSVAECVPSCLKKGAAPSWDDDKALVVGVERAVILSQDTKSAVLMRLARTEDIALSRRIYSVADRGSEPELVAITALMRDLAKVSRSTASHE